jgi:hypothetical protein
MIKSMVMEFILGLIPKNMLDGGLLVNSMDLEFLFPKRERKS